MRHALPVFCLLLTLTVLSASAGPRVRVVLATNNGEGIDGGLSDVTGSLGILKFTRFQLVESKSVAVGGVTSLAHGLTLKCSGTPTAYHVAVFRGGSKVTHADISLSAKRPLIVGGIPHGDGKIMLILSTN